MNYGQLKAQFIAMLNRRDITPTLTENFIKQAIQRAQRVLRVPSMEKSAIFSTNAGDGDVVIPGDLLEFVSVLWQDQSGYWHKLSRRDIGFVYSQRQIIDNPHYFARQDSQLVMGPIPSTAGQVRIDYYADFSNLSADSDSNWITDIAPDIVIYGGLSYASDYYLDDRKGAFEERFQMGIQELNTQKQMDELSAGAAISPAYGMNFGGPA